MSEGDRASDEPGSSVGVAILGQTWADRFYWGAVGLVGIAFSAVCLFEIANYFLGGHLGFASASYMQAARNSIRHGVVGAAKYYTGRSPPPDAAFHTHHPLMLHFHLVLLGAVFGLEEWIGRLVPVFYTFGSLVVLFATVRRYYDDGVALVSAALFAGIPIYGIYAGMIDHEQGALFWSLVYLFAYFRWVETERMRYAAVTMVGTTLAVQWEWIGYYLALFVVLHAFVRGLRRGGVTEWVPEYTFVGVFSAVVLLNAAAFFGYVASLEGGYQDLTGSFSQRTTIPAGYWERLLEQFRDLYGLLPLTLFAVWLAVLPVRAYRGDLHLGDWLPVYFLGVQTVHSTVFAQSGLVHAFWIWYLGPAVAVGGGFVLWRGAEWGWRGIRALCRRAGWSADWTGVRFAGAVVVFAAAVVPVALQADYALDQLAAGRARGGSFYVSPYTDRFDPVMFARAVDRRYDREETEFFLHPGIRDDPSFTFALDAPYQKRSAFSFPDDTGDRRPIFLVDLEAVDRRGALDRFVQRHGAILFDRRYLVVDAGRSSEDFRAFRREEHRPTLAWRFFVNGRQPRIEWEAIDDAERLRGLFSADVPVEGVCRVGGDEGDPIGWGCPSGAHLAGFDLASGPAHGTELVTSIRPICRPPPWASAEGGERMEGPIFGAEDAELTETLSCDSGEVVVGLDSRAGIYVDALGLVCADLERTGESGERPRSIEGSGRSLGPVGGPGGDRATCRCPEGTVAGGLSGRAGHWIDAVGLRCTSLTEGDGS